MKFKTVLIASVALLSLTFVSCKKDYTCTCTIGGAYFTHFDYSNMNDGLANGSCQIDEYLARQDYSNDSITCSLD